MFAAVDALDLPFLNSYLDSVGAPNFQKGSNFATGGSTILPAKANSTSPFSFRNQVAQFVRLKARALELQAKGTCHLLKSRTQYTFFCCHGHNIMHFNTYNGLSYKE